MTLGPTNEAIRRENHAEKNFDITVMIREVIEDERIVLQSKKHKIL